MSEPSSASNFSAACQARASIAAQPWALLNRKVRKRCALIPPNNMTGVSDRRIICLSIIRFIGLAAGCDLVRKIGEMKSSSAPCRFAIAISAGSCTGALWIRDRVSIALQSRPCTPSAFHNRANLGDPASNKIWPYLLARRRIC